MHTVAYSTSHQLNTKVSSRQGFCKLQLCLVHVESYVMKSHTHIQYLVCLRGGVEGCTARVCALCLNLSVSPTQVDLMFFFASVLKTSI